MAKIDELWRWLYGGELELCEGQESTASPRLAHPGAWIPRTGCKPTVTAAPLDWAGARAPCLHQGGPARNPLICKARPLCSQSKGDKAGDKRPRHA